jgi:hypothetical protein
MHDPAYWMYSLYPQGTMYGTNRADFGNEIIPIERLTVATLLFQKKVSASS